MLGVHHTEAEPHQQKTPPRVLAVVIPCYCVSEHLAGVVAAIGPEVDAIFCVDDGCPERSADTLGELKDDRVRIIRRMENGGVGAATCDGYKAALAAGADIIVKLDGDGQMDPRLIPALVGPIVRGEADYVKGNRFFSVQTIGKMNWTRILGNAGLSFLTKVSTGYWDLFDPTNGFTAIEARVARELPLEKLHPRYFFESDLLFRLGVLRAKVVDMPMVSIYGSEQSNLSELKALAVFPLLHLRNTLKRILYTYFLRGFSLASVNLVLGGILCGFGAVYGAANWRKSFETGVPATAGTVMLAALPVVLGAQLILSFISHDMSMTPSVPLHPRLTLPDAATHVPATIAK